jgi:hypothetical protein
MRPSLEIACPSLQIPCVISGAGNGTPGPALLRLSVAPESARVGHSIAPETRLSHGIAPEERRLAGAARPGGQAG